MTDVEKMILSDAIETSIESEKKIIILKRLLGVCLGVIITLIGLLIYG